jgi:hypothetical protein
MWNLVAGISSDIPDSCHHLSASSGFAFNTRLRSYVVSHFDCCSLFCRRFVYLPPYYNMLYKKALVDCLSQTSDCF